MILKILYAYFRTGSYLITGAIFFLLLCLADPDHHLNNAEITVLVISAILLTIVYLFFMIYNQLEGSYYYKNYFLLFSSIIFCLDLKFILSMPESYSCIFKAVLSNVLSLFCLFVFMIGLRKCDKDNKYLIDEKLHLFCLTTSVSVGFYDIAIPNFLLGLLFFMLLIFVSDRIFHFQHKLIEKKFNLRPEKDSILMRSTAISYIYNLKLYELFFEQESRHTFVYMHVISFWIPATLILFSKFPLIPCNILFLINLRRASALVHFNNVKKNPAILDQLQETIDRMSGWQRFRNAASKIINHTKENVYGKPGVPGGGGNKINTSVAVCGIGITTYFGVRAAKIAERANEINERLLRAQEEGDKINEKLLRAQEEGNKINEKLLEQTKVNNDLMREGNEHTARGADVYYNKISENQNSDIGID